MILAEPALSNKRAETRFRRRGNRPNVYAEAAGHEAILSMDRLGCSVGVVPEIVLASSLLKDEIRVLDVDAALKPYEIGRCVHKKRLASPVVLAF